MVNRELLWMPEGVKREGIHVKVCPPVPYGKERQRPSRLWSLHTFCCPDIKPPLTLELKHQESGFLEDEGHDWSIRQEYLFYRSRVSDGGHWLMLEFD